MTPSTKFLIGIAMLIALALVASYSYTTFHFVRAPLASLGTVIENPVVKFGDVLVIKQVFSRSRYCKTDVDRFILREPDKVLVRRERLGGPAGALGDSTVRIHIPTKLPAQAIIPFGISDPVLENLTPGRYTLRVFLHGDCGDRTHTLAIPDLPFTVIE